MKIDATNSTETALKTKTEKKAEFETEEGFDFKDFINTGMNGIMGNSQIFGNEYIINDFISTAKDDIKNLKSSFKYDCLTMDRDDALFFANSIKGENYNFSVNGEILMQNMATSTTSVAKTYKSAEVSKTLMDMLSDSMNSNKPVRIDFGNDISAVLRVSKDGKISAEFIPSDKVAEEYLKNNISYLQQTFQKNDIPYTELSYKQRQKERQEQSQNQNREEKGDK